MTTSASESATDWISKELEDDRMHRDRVRKVAEKLVEVVRASADSTAAMTQLRELVDGVDADLLRQALNEALHEGALEITEDRQVRVGSAA